MIIDYHKKFVFLHVPKCAGTAFEEAYQKVSVPSSFISGGTFSNYRVQEFHYRQYGVWKHSTATEILNRYPELSDFCFIALTRDSLSRAVSLWNFLVGLEDRKKRLRARASRQIKKVLRAGVVEEKQTDSRWRAQLDIVLEHKAKCQNPEDFFMSSGLLNSRLGMASDDFLKADVDIHEYNIKTLSTTTVSTEILKYTGVDVTEMARTNVSKPKKSLRVEDLSPRLVDYLLGCGF